MLWTPHPAQPSVLHTPACPKIWELQTFFLSPTELVREGFLSDKALGHVANGCVSYLMDAKAPNAERGCFFPPLMPSSSVKHCITLGHFILSFMPVLLNLPSSSFSFLLPQFYFSRCAELKAACLLHLGCLWQWHKHKALFLLTRRQVHEELRPKEKQASSSPSLSKPIDCWSKRQALKQPGVGWLLLWVTMQGPFSPRCGYLFPVKVKNHSLLKAFSKFPSFWSDAMKWPGMTYWLGKPSHSWSLVFTWC